MPAGAQVDDVRAVGGHDRQADGQPLQDPGDRHHMARAGDGEGQAFGQQLGEVRAGGVGQLRARVQQGAVEIGNVEAHGEGRLSGGRKLSGIRTPRKGWTSYARVGGPILGPMSADARIPPDGSAASDAAASPPIPPTRRWLPWVVALAFFMQTLDTTIVNTALPAMARSLGEDPLRMQSAVVAYLLTVALLIPASGWLADRFGTRTVFMWAIGLFTLGSLACAGGVGGALLLPVGRLAGAARLPEVRVPLGDDLHQPAGPGRPAAGADAGRCADPFVSWHWVFLINLPVGLAGAWACRRYMPQISDRWAAFRLERLSAVRYRADADVAGAAGLRRARGEHRRLRRDAGGRRGLHDGYWLHATRTEEPLFSPVLFKVPTFRIGLLGNVFARLGSGATPFLTPLFLQLGLGFTPSEAGLSMIPSVLGAMFTKTLATRLIRRAGYRQVLIVNTLLLGGLIASFSLIPHGVGHVMQFTAMNTLTLGDLDERTASGGNSLLAVVMQLSMSLGVATSSAFLLLFSHGLPRSEGSALVPAFHMTYLALGAMAAMAAFIFYQLRRDEGTAEETADSKLAGE
ncbi:major facilitator superfamily domain-containing protein [Ditylenchus destructor]|nr:major facilitator superfamily domain-containing protein [Ditylenchus destructor]